MKQSGKFYALQLVMLLIMLVMGFSFAELSMGRNKSLEMILLYIALTVLYLVLYGLMRYQTRRGKASQQIGVLLQTDVVYNLIHIFNEKVGFICTLIMALGSILPFFLKV